MLNNLTNFFNLIKGGKIKKTLEGSDLLPIGTRDTRYGGNYQPTGVQYADLEAQLAEAASRVTADKGTKIAFNKQKIYNTHIVPGAGHITQDLTDAQIGIVQKIYHNSLIAPSMPAGWVLVGEGFYVPGTLNIIYAEWCGSGRIEYWVTQ